MSWFKRLFSSSATKSTDTDAPAGKQDIVQDDGEADVRETGNIAGSAAMPGIAGPEAAETAEGDLSEFEKPPDPAP